MLQGSCALGPEATDAGRVHITVRVDGNGLTGVRVESHRSESRIERHPDHGAGKVLPIVFFGVLFTLRELCEICSQGQ